MDADTDADAGAASAAERPPPLGEHLRAGLLLCRGVSGLNSVVGDCVFNIFVTNTLSAILTSYASFAVVFSDSASHVPALFSTMNLVLTALFLGRLYQLTSTGQRLIRSLEESRFLTPF